MFEPFREREGRGLRTGNDPAVPTLGSQGWGFVEDKSTSSLISKTVEIQQGMGASWQ